MTHITNEAVNDSEPAVLNMLGESLARAASLKIDHAFYEGTGATPVPPGLLNVTGVQTVDNGAAALTNLDPFAEAIYAKLGGVNATAGAIAMHPLDWSPLTKLKEATGSNKALLQESAGSAQQPVDQQGARTQAAGMIYGVPVYLSSQITAGTTFVYDPSRLYLVTRSDVSIETDTSPLFTMDSTVARVVARVGFGHPYPEAVCLITNYTPA